MQNTNLSLSLRTWTEAISQKGNTFTRTTFFRRAERYSTALAFLLSTSPSNVVVAVCCRRVRCTRITRQHLSYYSLATDLRCTIYHISPGASYYSVFVEPFQQTLAERCCCTWNLVATSSHISGYILQYLRHLPATSRDKNPFERADVLYLLVTHPSSRSLTCNADLLLKDSSLGKGQGER